MNYYNNYIHNYHSPYKNVEHKPDTGFQNNSHASKISMPRIRVPVQNQNSIQTAARCPHGFPGGACPICLGKTGGGGKNEKLKKTGMSWSEAYLIWSGIQMAKLGLIEAINMQNAFFQKIQERLIQLMNQLGFTRKLLMARALLIQHMTALAQNLNALKNNAVKTLQPVINTLNTVISNVKQTLMQLIMATNNLAAIMGEKIRNIEAQIRENIKKIMQRLMASETILRLIKIFHESERKLREYLGRQIRSINKKIAELIVLINSIIREKPDKREKRQGKKKQKEK